MNANRLRKERIGVRRKGGSGMGGGTEKEGGKEKEEGKKLKR